MKKILIAILAIICLNTLCAADSPPAQESFSSGCSISPKIVFYNASLSGRFGDELVAGYRGRYQLEYHISSMEAESNYTVNHWAAVVCNGRIISNSSLTTEAKTLDGINKRLMDLGFDVPNQMGDCYIEYIIYGIDSSIRCNSKPCYCSVGSFPTNLMETPVSPIFAESTYYQLKNMQELIQRGEDEKEQIIFLRNQSSEQLRNIQQQTTATILLAIATFIMAFGTIWLAW